MCDAGQGDGIFLQELDQIISRCLPFHVRRQSENNFVRRFLFHSFEEGGDAQIFRSDPVERRDPPA